MSKIDIREKTAIKNFQILGMSELDFNVNEVAPNVENFNFINDRNKDRRTVGVYIPKHLNYKELNFQCDIPAGLPGTAQTIFAFVYNQFMKNNVRMNTKVELVVNLFKLF